MQVEPSTNIKSAAICKGCDRWHHLQGTYVDMRKVVIYQSFSSRTGGLRISKRGDANLTFWPIFPENCLKEIEGADSALPPPPPPVDLPIRWTTFARPGGKSPPPLRSWVTYHIYVLAKCTVWLIFKSNLSATNNGNKITKLTLWKDIYLKKNYFTTKCLLNDERSEWKYLNIFKIDKNQRDVPDKLMEFSLNVFTEFAEFSDKKI